MSAPFPSSAEAGVPRASAEPVPAATQTLILDWEGERAAGGAPRRVDVPPDAAVPTWVVVPRARYVLCARHLQGRVETVYVASLVGKRDSLIPAGAVDSIAMDDHSATVVVDGRPYLYSVDHGTTLDVLSRRVLGAG